MRLFGYVIFFLYLCSPNFVRMYICAYEENERRKMNDVLLYSQLLAAIATIGAFVYAIVQVRQSKKQKRAEFIVQLHSMFVQDEDMLEMFYKIEYGDFDFNNLQMTPDEKKLDKLLGHFNNICRLHEMKILKDEDIELMRYEICRVAQNSQVQKYFKWLDENWMPRAGFDEVKFSSLRRYTEFEYNNKQG